MRAAGQNSAAAHASSSVRRRGGSRFSGSSGLLSRYRTGRGVLAVPNLLSRRVSHFPAGDALAVAGADFAHLDDEELVRRTRSGQRAAFDALIERYQKRATTVSYRLVGNLHDALEVCQEAFVRAYRGLDTLEDQQRFGGWLLRIVSNLSLNFRRDRAVGGPRVSLDDCIAPGDEPRARVLSDADHSDERPGARLGAAELAELVQARLADLPEQQRLALVLFSIEQLPQKEVASIMNCSVEAVKWHVFQARMRLKDELADYL